MDHNTSHTPNGERPEPKVPGRDGSQPAQKTIHVTFGWPPKISRPSKSTVRKHAHRYLFTKKAVIATIGVVVVVGSLTAGALINQQNAAKETTDNSNPDSIVENLEYQTVLPDGKSISQLGGWKRVSPLKNDPVYAYSDKIGSIPINVSQQPLPNSFKDNTDSQVAKLAKKFSATTKIDAGDTIVYVGTSFKGPQSVIFTKNSLLILIKSTTKVTDDDWTKYVQSLN